MTTVSGLPAHVLLVHGVVVLVPLVAVLLLVQAFWPAARRRLSILTGVLAVLTLILVPITTEAGEWLEHRIPRSPVVEAHTEIGDDMLPWAIGLAVVALGFVAWQAFARRRTGAAVAVVMAVLSVVVAGGSVYTVYQIGDSGARAAWTGQFSPTPLPGQQRPPEGDG